MIDINEPIVIGEVEDKFAVLIVRYNDRSKAFREAFNCPPTMDRSKLTKEANRLANKPHVKKRVEQLQQQVIDMLNKERASVVTEMLYDKLSVFQHWNDIVLADVAKIVRHRRVCCRYCHGKNYRYQWIDQAEFDKAVAEVELENTTRKRGKHPQQPPLALPSEDGGYGFKRILLPMPGCPKCHGEGHAEIFMTDTSLLDQRERRLIKGIKMTKYGPEIQFHDQMDALSMMAKALGMVTDKFVITDPSQPADVPPALPMDPIEASRRYAEFVKAV